jgi:phosphoglycerate dehydrogenase-like enzyme
MQILIPDHLKEELTPQLQAIDSLIRVLAVDVAGRVETGPNEAEALLRYFPNSLFPGHSFDAETLKRVIAVSPRLKWIHNGFTGMDRVLYPELIASDIVLTNAAGAQRDALAEGVLAMMLASAKRLREHLAHQDQRRWQHVPHSTLKARTVTIVGLGRVGVAVARRCHAFDMRIIGIKRRPGNPLPSIVERIETPDNLAAILPGTDYLVITAALTPETRGLIGEKELRLLPPQATLVNIARGAIVDEPALLRALREGWLAGAGLDVFDVEPLPESSPFWTLPNVIITPHNAGKSGNAGGEAMSIFLDNVRRYITGQPLRNMVDKQAGYSVSEF